MGGPPQTAAEPPHPENLRVSEGRRSRRMTTTAELPHPNLFKWLCVRRFSKRPTAATAAENRRKSRFMTV
jgi:hypothetical protein